MIILFKSIFSGVRATGEHIHGPRGDRESGIATVFVSARAVHTFPLHGSLRNFQKKGDRYLKIADFNFYFSIARSFSSSSAL